MPTVTIKRPSADGPFRKGDAYHVAASETDDHFTSGISNVEPLSEKYVQLTLELSRDDYAALMAAGGPADPP